MCAVNHYWQLSPNMAAQLVNDLCCTKHCWGVNEKIALWIGIRVTPCCISVMIGQMTGQPKGWSLLIMTISVSVRERKFPPAVFFCDSELHCDNSDNHWKNVEGDNIVQSSKDCLNGGCLTREKNIMRCISWSNRNGKWKISAIKWLNKVFTNAQHWQ